MCLCVCDNELVHYRSAKVVIFVICGLQSAYYFRIKYAKYKGVYEAKIKMRITALPLVAII